MVAGVVFGGVARGPIDVRGRLEVVVTLKALNVLQPERVSTLSV